MDEARFWHLYSLSSLLTSRICSGFAPCNKMERMSLLGRATTLFQSGAKEEIRESWAWAESGLTGLDIFEHRRELRASWKGSYSAGCVCLGRAELSPPPHRSIHHWPQHPLPFLSLPHRHCVSFSSSSLAPQKTQPNHHHAAPLQPHSRNPRGRRPAAGGGAMGPGPDAAGWTAEDDVLLKNAVEVIGASRPDPSIPLPYTQKLPGKLRRVRLVPYGAEFCRSPSASRRAGR